MVKPWVDSPFPLISTPTAARTKGLSAGTIRIATEMSLAHNIMLRGLNSIYLQAPQITLPSDQRDFTTYCQMWLELLHEHHSMEERYLFPRIEDLIQKPGFLEGNVQQHHDFEKGVEEFREYVYGLNGQNGNGFDAQEVRRLIDGFVEVLVKHLREEIESLLALDEFGGEGGELLLQAWGELDVKIVKEMGDKSRVLPFGLGSNDTTFEGGKYIFPKFPWFVPVMTSWIFWWKYRSVWRFNPCTVYGVPRELEFVLDE